MESHGVLKKDLFLGTSASHTHYQKPLPLGVTILTHTLLFPLVRAIQVLRALLCVPKFDIQFPGMTVYDGLSLDRPS